MLPIEKKSRAFPKWFEWLLVVIMVLLAWLEYTHGERFWAGFFVVLAVVIGASSFFVKKADSHGQ